jgi:DNA-binding LacI/PurR family transcriptional regulator
LIGLIVPNLDNPLYVQYLRGVEQAARPARCLLLVCDAHDEPEEALLFFRMLAEKGVDGILVFSFALGERLPAEAHCGGGAIPFVTVDWAGVAGCSVSCDFESGAHQAVRHLLATGRRRIGLIAYAFDVPAVRQMRAGYEQALAEAGLALDPTLVVPLGKFTMETGEQAARALLRLPEPPDAIFAMSDLMAIGALQAIRAAGLRIPEDIALVGSNDIPLAGLIDPPLTTLHQPAYEMGQAGMELLLELIGGGSERRQEAQSLVLPVELVIRQST